MNFDEWWKDSNGALLTGQPAVMQLTFRKIAEKSWDTAVAAERERCAKLPRLPMPRVLASGTIAGKTIELRGWHTNDIEIWERQHGLKFGA